MSKHQSKKCPPPQLPQSRANWGWAKPNLTLSLLGSSKTSPSR